MVLSVIVASDDIGAAASKASKADSLLGKAGTFTKSVVVSSAKNAKRVLTKVKGTLSDVGTVSGVFAKAFGKTYVKECSKYANTCFSVSGAAEAGYKGIVAEFKEAKSVLKVVKGEENGLADVVSNADLDAYRAELRVSERNTIAVGKTDVKGLEEYTFKGASPQVIKDAKKAGIEVKTIDEEFPNRSIKAPWILTGVAMVNLHVMRRKE